MKFHTALAFAASLLASVNASATLLKDVGGVDNFIASETLTNSGNNTELNWVRNALNDQTITLDEKYDSAGSDWQLLTGETDIYSTSLLNSPGYFLLKFGIGKTGVDSHLLYENIGDLTCRLIDFSEAGIDLLSIKKFHIGKISHVDEFGTSPNQPQGTTPGNTTPIPEPMTISLFALVLLTLVRRNR